MTETPARTTISTSRAPKAIGPYAQAIRHGNLVFASGQIGLDPVTGEVVPGGIEAQTRQALSNLKGVLEAAGAGIDTVLKTTVFLVEIQDFGAMNTVYGELMSAEPPSRSTIAVKALPKGALVEIEAVAAVRRAEVD